MEELSSATGVLAISIPHEMPAMIVWFRPELREQIVWAGNPEAAKNISPDGKIHPRSSFATYLQTTAGTAKKWSESDLAAADQLRSAMAGIAVRDGTAKITADEKGTFRLSLANALATNAKSEKENMNGNTPETADLTDFIESGRLLLEGFSEVSIMVLNADGEIKNWSSGASELLGLNHDHSVKKFRDLFSDEDALGGKADRILDFAQKNTKADDEVWVFKKDRTSFWAKITVSRVLSGSSKIVGYTVIVRDITEEKSAEEELKATKLAAEAASVAKTSFIANISHEIRTPLGAILGFSEVMAQKNQSSEQRENLYLRIKRNGEQLIALINDLLDVTKIEAGKLEIESISFDLQNLLTDLRDTFSIKAAEKSISFKIEVRGQLPKNVVSDPTRIRQILVNLLSNAIKFTDNGGSVTLTASIESVLQGKEMLTFRVKDTGRGMSEIEMSKLFQPFVQADVSTTRKYGGTGLGLFVSQRLARGLGGDLNIENSILGIGTVFLARVSAEIQSGTETFNALGEMKADSEFTTGFEKELNFHGKKVLVVDDAVDNRALVEHFLRGTSIKIDSAENGVEALDKISAAEYDLVLMDIQMPVMDGNTAMRRLKEAGFKVPVIALTANAMQGEKEISLGLGFSDYLTKPINKQSLRASLRNWLTHRH